MTAIAVIIPTFRRPESLERAITSILKQDCLETLAAEVTVVDNDPEGSARTTVERLLAMGATLCYVHAPDPGVSNARNAGVASTKAPLIAFLDDDEEAPPHWLGALHAAHTALGADVTFGPVRGRAENTAMWKRLYLENFFSRSGPNVSALTNEVYGCGCSMMTRSTALAGHAPFDLCANETGGEDDRLFERLKSEGRRFAWCAEAWVWEHPLQTRQTALYALKRGFSYGQTPSQIAARAKNLPSLCKWMAVGVGQAGVFALAALLVAPFDLKRALPLADRAARGLGKVFWFKSLKFYGRAAVRSPLHADQSLVRAALA